MPPLEVLETESFHVKFPYPFGGNDFEEIALVDGYAATGGEARLAQGAEVGRCLGIFTLSAIGLGADEVLLGEPEELRHADVVDVQAQQGLVAEVLDQQGPLEAMAVACLKFAEIAVVTAVCTLIEVQYRLGRDEVRIVIVVVSCQVEEDRARGGSIGGGGVA